MAGTWWSRIGRASASRSARRSWRSSRSSRTRRGAGSARTARSRTRTEDTPHPPAPSPLRWRGGAGYEAPPLRRGEGAGGWGISREGIMGRLQDKVAVITGAAHGIGRGIALAYSKEGAKVVVCDLDRDPSVGHAEEVAKLISEAGGEVEVFLGDASDGSDMQRVIASTVERFGRVDILVNNANPGHRDPNASREFLHHTEEHVYQGYLLPFKAAYFNTQMAAKEMIKQGGGGNIITITSVHQERAWGWDSIYGPMKAALRRLVMSQARELAPHKIRVNCIA